MCAMIYKHRPSFGALTGAAITLIFGCSIIWIQISSLRLGEELPATVLMTGSMTSVLFGVFLIIAFARYKYTHLWRRSSPRPRNGAQQHLHAHAPSTQREG